MNDNIEESCISTAAARQAAFDAMLPATKEPALKIRELFEKRDNSLVAHYDIGSLIASALDREVEYGPNAVEQFAAFLGISDMELYGCRNVAAVYARDKFTNLVHRQMTKSHHLTWEHLQRLAEVRPGSARGRLEELTFANSWSVRELSDAIRGGPDGQITKLRVDPGSTTEGKMPEPTKAYRNDVARELSEQRQAVSMQEASMPAHDNLSPDQTQKLLRALNDLLPKIENVDHLTEPQAMRLLREVYDDVRRTKQELEDG